MTIIEGQAEELKKLREYMKKLKGKMTYEERLIIAQDKARELGIK